MSLAESIVPLLTVLWFSTIVKLYSLSNRLDRIERKLEEKK